MKKTLLSLLVIIGLQGAPAPAHAGNGMTDIISTMMQMFLWMMSGGSGMSSGFNPNSFSSMGGLSPYGLNPGLNSGLNPFGGNSYGMNPYGVTPYAPGGYGAWNRYPYSQNSYGTNAPYYDPYTGQYRGNNYDAGRPYYNPAYDSHRQEYANQNKAPSVIIQPIIVSPGEKADGTATAKVEVLPVQPVEPPAATAEKNYPAVPPPASNEYAPAFTTEQAMLAGRWQGVNGEFMELSRDSFFLRTRNSELRGTYLLKNGIMKIAVVNKTRPIYMQYRITQGKLVFRSEDGQMMLFRRVG